MDPLVRALDASARWGSDYSLQTILLGLLLSLVLGQLVAWAYMWTHSGLSYSRTFTQGLVLLTMVVALVLHVIGANIVTAFGLLGALALIRFRNVLKDTRDTVFIFISLVVGMAVGSQRYLSAVVGTVVLILTALYLHFSAFGTPTRFDGYLTLRVGEKGPPQSVAESMIREFCRNVRPISVRRGPNGGGTEFVYNVGLREEESGPALLARLRSIEGVEDAGLILRKEVSEA